MSEIIYFDNNATTKPDERVVEAMLPYFYSYYGNEASTMHAFGWAAQSAVEQARMEVASLIGSEKSEIVFTSGATESINMALQGIYAAYKTKGNHIITVKTEHKAVLDTCKFLEANRKASVTYLNVNREGLIDLEELERAIRKETILICVMAANNETGVIMPYQEIGELARSRKIIFFTDATQYAGKMKLYVNEMNADVLCLSAHKMFGPKGIGALYIRRKNPRVNLIPLIHGGGQENNRRAGTVNVPSIVGFGKACTIAASEMWENNAKVSKLRAHFEHQLLEVDGLRINGNTKNRLYNTSNLTFPKVLDIKLLVKKFAFSSGSACTGTDLSHVLQAMQISNDEIRNSFRFSFSHHNDLNEVNALLVELMDFLRK